MHKKIFVKKILYLLLIIINIPRLILPAIILVFYKSIRVINSYDSENLKKLYKAKSFNFSYNLLTNHAYRSIFCFRVKTKNKILGTIMELIFGSRLNIEITGDIGPGFKIYHGQSCIIHPIRAGKNFSVYQNVTVGRNKEHYSKEGFDFPVIGDNVSLYTSCVVSGGIIIGNNVEIGANAVVLKDVPDNCTVVGNPAYIVKQDGKKVHKQL